ncbi:MAG: 30S ribosomal protein S21 [Bacilli bacterium]|jgi:small subunit ribosomal protein S21|nr:30S ribosomal protein S21 [Bacilli bacterium]
MPKTVVHDNESFDDAMRRFKRQVNKSGVLADQKRHQAFYKKGLKRKMKSEQARRKFRH